MKPLYCNQCGSPLIESSDIHPHKRCSGCRTITYRNPTVGVAIIIMEENKLLLVKRGVGDYQGSWCIPCGHLDYDEDVRDAALRELLEETGLEAVIEGVYDVHSNWHNAESQTVGIWFKGKVCGGSLRAGDDACEVGFFPLDALPTLCYPTDILIINRLISSVL